jgi:5-formyltetrahydrofolate cyclo-ligase
MVQIAKKNIRKKMLEQRDSQSVDECASNNTAIMKRLLEEDHVQKAEVIALYMAKGSEVQTREIIAKLIEMGKKICLPVVGDNNHLDLYLFESFDALKKGKFGVLEPENKREPSKLPDVIIIPGVAFGLCMHRLGYGKGYYDRLLAKLPSYRIGICFDFQLVEELPKHEDDQRMHRIITEKREVV